MDEHEDLHNKLKYHQMISDEQITSDNVKISKLKSARVAQLTEKNDMLKKNISASKPKLHESRGKRRMPIVRSFRLRDEGCAEQDEDNPWLHQ